MSILTWKRPAFASFVLFLLPIHPTFLQAQDRSPQESQLTLPQLAGPRPWTDKALYNDPRHFQFVIVSDLTGGHRDGVFEAAIDKINDLRPEFVISVGDLIEGLTDDAEQIDREWKEFNGFLEPLAMRFFYVPGNHDIWSAQARREWEQRFGRSYYHFVYKDVLFLCLNSEDGGPTQLAEDQAACVEKTLRENSDVRWTLIFLHKALWAYQQEGRPTLWNRVEEALGGRPHTIFAGHRHQYVAYQRENYKYYELATTGGGSSLAGPVHGRFDHVVWVTMDEKGPVLANLQLDGILDSEVRTEAGEKLIRELSNRYGLELEPVIMPPGRAFKGGRTRLKITNRADLPMEVQGQFAHHSVLRPYPYAFSRTVGADSVEEVEFRLDSPEAIQSPETAIVPLDVTITYRPEGLRKPLVWERTIFAVVDRPVSVPRVRSNCPVLLDGKLDEWPDLSLSADHPSQVTGAASVWDGPQDTSFRFGLQQDSESLYIAMDVKDDVWTTRPGSDSRGQDYGGLLLDARSAAQRNAQGKGRNYQSRILNLALIPAKIRGESTVLSRGVEAPGIQVFSSPSPTGYTLECAIPHQLLDNIQGRPWESIRLNLFAFDIDSLTGSRVLVWWRPGWNTMESYPGSGTFVRR